MDRHEPPQGGNSDGSDYNDGTNVFVVGLGQLTREKDLTEICSKYGKVTSCEIMVDPHTEVSRGFGFVRMNSKEEAAQLIAALNGSKIDGAPIRARLSRRGGGRPATPGVFLGKYPPTFLPPPGRGVEPYYARDPYARDYYARDPYYRPPPPPHGAPLHAAPPPPGVAAGAPAPAYGQAPAYERDPYYRDPYYDPRMSRPYDDPYRSGYARSPYDYPPRRDPYAAAPTAAGSTASTPASDPSGAPATATAPSGAPVPASGPPRQPHYVPPEYGRPPAGYDSGYAYGTY